MKTISSSRRELIKSPPRFPPSARDGRRHDHWPRQSYSNPDCRIDQCASGLWVFSFLPNLKDGAVYFYVYGPPGDRASAQRLLDDYHSPFLDFAQDKAEGENYNYFLRGEETAKFSVEEFEAWLLAN